MPMPGQSPQQEAAEGPEDPGTITLNMSAQGITITSAEGTKQCESIGECLQTLLEMYESMSGGESGESAMMAGYADQAPQEQRPIGGGAVK